MSGPGKRLLVHMCCGPCSIYPIKEALGSEMEVWGFFYNPNIQPRSEYVKRLEAVKILADTMGIDVLYKDDYAPNFFVRDDRGRLLKELDKGDRCAYCYTFRLEATAEAAKENGFDLFSTSLLYSKYQDHDFIRVRGQELARRFGVGFLYDDFRRFWRQGIDESREMGLYRQKYCGCIYSYLERYDIPSARSRTGGRVQGKVG